MLKPALLALATVSGCASVQWTPHAGEPPSELFHLDRVVTLDYEDGPVGKVRYFIPLKKLAIDWSDLSSRGTRSQDVPLSYWPTCVCPFPDLDPARETLLVAGRRKNGNTVIEKWIVRKPLLQQPVPGTAGAPVLHAAVIESIDTIYDDAHEGRDMVEDMTPLLDREDAVLVHFYDHDYVFQMHFGVNPPSLRLVAAPTPQGGDVLTVPALTSRFAGVWSGKHETFGNAYVFAGSRDLLESPVLLDADEDGDIDGFALVGAAEWGASWNGKFVE